jgi:hypothetical protein
MLETQGLGAWSCFCCADGEQLALNDGAADAAFLGFALELFGNPAFTRLPSECQRVLDKADGLESPLNARLKTAGGGR